MHSLVIGQMSWWGGEEVEIASILNPSPATWEITEGDASQFSAKGGVYGIVDESDRRGNKRFYSVD